jgi:hypothetical protein
LRKFYKMSSFEIPNPDKNSAPAHSWRRLDDFLTDSVLNLGTTEADLVIVFESSHTGTSPLRVAVSSRTGLPFDTAATSKPSASPSPRNSRPPEPFSLVQRAMHRPW